ncbi:hypothetical protein [Phormidesmis priestleyi]|nr:hypothetical protein [Phormidesmis priestleyi]
MSLRHGEINETFHRNMKRFTETSLQRWVNLWSIAFASRFGTDLPI